jgi:hypothetical protein
MNSKKLSRSIILTAKRDIAGIDSSSKIRRSRNVEKQFYWFSKSRKRKSKGRITRE